MNSKNIPSFKKWIKMTGQEQRKVYLKWNVYAGEGQEIAQRVLAKFKEKYSNIPNLKINDAVGLYHGGTWVIQIGHPFIFDRRRIPKKFLGIEVKGGALLEDLPKEFQIKDREKDYIWAPERYEKFVDRCADKIRKELGNPNMSRDDMLDALVGGRFEKYVKQCKKWKEEGVIPRSKGDVP